jgi:hypothetical protein
MAASCCTRMAWRIVPPRASVAVLAPRVWAHVSVGDGLVVRGGDFSCEAETCRGGPSSGELVGDAANWPKTGRLASVGLDQDLFLLLVLNLCLDVVNLGLHIVNGVGLSYVLGEIISPSKGVLIRALVIYSHHQALKCTILKLLLIVRCNHNVCRVILN